MSYDFNHRDAKDISKVFRKEGWLIMEAIKKLTFAIIA